MKKQTANENRRAFLKTLVPAGAMLCVGCPGALASDIQDDGKQDQVFESKIKNEFSISYEKYFYARFDHFIGTMENFANYMGRDKLIKMLKRSTDDKNLQRKPNEEATSVRDFINPFLESEFFENSQDLEVLKLTDHVCEIKVTNCLWAKAFRRKNAGDIGYANTCHGDFSLAKAYNPKLRMERTKTLMEGHDCCNHRYIWEG